MAKTSIITKKKIVEKIIKVEEEEKVVNIELTLEEAATLRAIARYTHTDTKEGQHIGFLYNLLSGFQNREMQIIPEKHVKFEITSEGHGLRIYQL